ncbi:MAG TPA: PQQ-binding-like beta-propeller repeat protein [Gaiellaceae bacterium]
MLKPAASVALLVGALVVLPSFGVAGGSTADWPSYLRDSSHSSYNAAAVSIGPAQMATLGPVWRWNDPASAMLFASPTVSQGVIYQGDDAGTLFAIRESDRAILWSRFIGHVQKTTCWSQGIVSTPTVAADPTTGKPTVYDSGPDGNLYALDAATGAVLWTSRVDTPSASVNDYFAWSSPLVANGKIYIGVASQCDQPLVHGGLAVFAQKTGARLASRPTMLDNSLGGDVWSTPAVLPNGSVVATTGNGTDGLPQTNWADSVIRYDGTSLAILDAWQIPAVQRNDDSDFGGSPTLFTATLHGIATPMVGACNKNGEFYAFRQVDLHDGPVWQDNLGQPGTIGFDACFAAAMWTGSQLLLSGSGPTTIGGITYDGSVRSVDPATGAVRWQTGIPAAVFGSPAEDGAGLIAVPGYSSSTGTYGVFLVRASDGAVLGQLPAQGVIFSQPVFANGDLLVAGGPAIGLTAYDVTTSGPPLTNVSPAFIRPGQTKTVTVTGAALSGNPTVFVSGFGVVPTAIQVVSSTKLAVTLAAGPGTALGARGLRVVEPGATADICGACLVVVPPSTTIVTSSLNPSHVGQPVTFTASIAKTDGGGTVSFAADGVTIAGCGAKPLTTVGTGTGRASCTTSTLTAKTHTISASYSGDNAAGDSSATLSGGQVMQP